MCYLGKTVTTYLHLLSSFVACCPSAQGCARNYAAPQRAVGRLESNTLDVILQRAISNAIVCRHDMQHAYQEPVTQ